MFDLLNLLKFCYTLLYYENRAYMNYIGSCPSQGATDSLLGLYITKAPPRPKGPFYDVTSDLADISWQHDIILDYETACHTPVTKAPRKYFLVMVAKLLLGSRESQICPVSHQYPTIASVLLVLQIPDLSANFLCGGLPWQHIGYHGNYTLCVFS